MTNNRTILITGVTGNQGGAVAQALQGTGFHLRGLTRKPYSVNAVYFDHSGAMWVGTQDGLDKFDAKTRRFESYYERDGLGGNVVSCILEDERGKLWMSTNNGLSVLDPSKKAFKHYSSAYGLPGADLTGWAACCKSSSGE